MARPTTITVSTDRAEYSRYEDSRSAISATVVSTGGAPYSSATDIVTVELRKARRDRDAVVADSDLGLSAGTGSDTQSVSFDLTTLVDDDNINLVRHGRYFIRASYPAASASATLGSGANGTVTITVDEGGSAGNSYTIEVVVDPGTVGMSASLSGTTITLNLETVAGVAQASNTAAQIAALLSSLEGITAEASGTGAGTITVASGPTAFTGGEDEVYGESDDFDISIVTAERLRQTYLYGLPLGATLSRQVRYQPTNVTGVTVVHLSEEHPFGFYTLAYNESSAGVRTLSWGGGTSTTITTSGRYLLKTGSGATNSPLAKLQLPQSVSPNYIEVQVSFADLPSASTSDELLVEKQTMDDDMLRSFVRQATDWLEQVALQTYVEPTNVVTDLDPTSLAYTQGTGTPVNPAMVDADYDFIVNPLTYFSQQADQWLQIQTPFMNILRVDLLFGAIASVRVIDVDLDWVEHSGKGGLIQLIPFNTQVAFSAAGLLWIGSLRSPTELPNFWHFDMMVGLPDCPPNLQEIIAKRAAIDALVLLGQALRPGVGSLSLGRDGVSQSISYTNQAQYGAYTGTISLFKEWIEKELKNYRGSYRGPMMVVV